MSLPIPLGQTTYPGPRSSTWKPPIAMSQSFIAPRSPRGLIAVSGEDRVAFLQGLVSNDVTRVSETRAIHAALLTPQGKYLHDFFVMALGDVRLLETEGESAAGLKRRV